MSNIRHHQPMKPRRFHSTNRTNYNAHQQTSRSNSDVNRNRNWNSKSFPIKRHSTTTSDTPATKRPCLPAVSYRTLTNLLDKPPDEILTEMVHSNFQLNQFLNDKRIQERYDWIYSMTVLLEKITYCNQSRERIVTIFEQLPNTLYLEGVYEEIRKIDPETKQIRFEFIKLFLKILNKFLSMMPHSADGFTKISERLELQFTKIQSDSQEFIDAKEILNEVLERRQEIEKKEEIIISNIGQPPNNYRQLSIVPDIRELLSDERPYLRKNIINGVYENAQQYLDIHFRLLREDFVGPLRDGIRDYLSKSERKNHNIRIYENVHLRGSRLTQRNGLVYDLVLDHKIASRIFWTNSRRLIYGNLLLLTFNNFQSCSFVTVEDRSQIEKNFIISVKTLDDEQVQNDLDTIDPSCSLTMIETTTYFEAYRPVLDALQNILADHRFPLTPFLLKLTNERISPDYIKSTTTYDFTPLLVGPDSHVQSSLTNHKQFKLKYQQEAQIDNKYKTVSVLNQNGWPTSEQLHLNPKQYEALILALTNKVALIQGPPGTGKTFLGVRITEMLLHNRSVWCPSQEQATPILMICYTNHALDQFLELIVERLNIQKGIVRVGSQCQNPKIQQFSLQNARRSAREYRSLPNDVCKRRCEIFQEKLATEAKNKRNDICEEEEEEEQRRRDEINMEEEEYSSPLVRENRDVEKKSNDIDQLVQRIIQKSTTLNDETIRYISDNLWELKWEQRYDLYRYWLWEYQKQLHNSISNHSRVYNQVSSALAEHRQDEDYYLLKDSIIVAMTTTCAAKYHTILEKLKSKIVIVEEAAAIFEAHVITALNSKCEHLILIGDHVQLKPNPNVYHLGTKYHLDVSLFERLIKNKLPNVRLNIQHRMRPEISRLMKHFYDDLEDHQSVQTDRESISGIDTNVFFINHSNMETTIDDGSSKRNEYEAKYVIELAQYLIKQGYQSKQITILVMYLGQRQFIAKQAKSIRNLQGVRILVTDNYQGEENDIIILSLVRSNVEKQIGFLKIHNRICVALSRARCGLFVIGNMNLLGEVDEMWKKIISSLLETNQIGKGLTLSCRQHPQDRILADKPESFAQRPEGGCRKTCDTRLECGHRCELTCHNYDLEHGNIVCHKKCSERLSCGHLCTKKCHFQTPDQHSSCYISVEKIIPECGHKIQIECCENPTNQDCKKATLKQLPCNHMVEVPCRIISSLNELKRFSCPKPCETILECTHKCVGKCGQCYAGRLHVPCGEKCKRELICSHVCKASCTIDCPPCSRECQIHCVHSRCKKKCGEICSPCKEQCDYRCKHFRCTRQCSELCDRGPCNEPCYRKLRCGHSCIGMCGELCPRECRICDKDKVEETFFGTEDEPDARFIVLPDCRHIFEVTSLDRFMEDFVKKSDGQTAIRFPECPLCRQKVYECKRYTPIINQAYDLIIQVKKKILGNKSKEEINSRRKQLVDKYERIRKNFQEIQFNASMERFFSILYKDNHCFSDDKLNLITNTMTFLQEIYKIRMDGSEKLQNHLFEEQVNEPLNQIMKYFFKQERNFAEQQLNDIQSELERIRRVICIETFICSLKQNLEENEKEGLKSMRDLTRKSGRFTDQDQEKFDELMKKFQHLTHLPGLGITDDERIQIVRAFNMGKGHWYTCPNGHPYIITECGGANQESQCPQCQERIGGQNHRLLDTNRHFGVMDGSQHSAWSNEANLNVPR
ncbi:hypothetical protein I4U23_022418 [Adineta vaga]|nr:hypothetical protein I4U23_022418 [Adineta vaga]